MSPIPARPPRTTENLGLPIPGGESPPDYITATGALADAIDLLAARLFSPGDLKMSAGTQVPDGWLLCDGQAVSRTTYAELFAAIGVTHGAGDGSTTFNIPDYRNVFPIGAAGPAAVGQRGGAATVTLSVNEMPSHNHPIGDPGHAHGVADPQHGHYPYPGSFAFLGHSGVATDLGVQNVPGNIAVNLPPYTGSSPTNVGIYAAATGVVAGHNGSGWPHENRPPFATVNFFIKT